MKDQLVLSLAELEREAAVLEPSRVEDDAVELDEVEGHRPDVEEGGSGARAETQPGDRPEGPRVGRQVQGDVVPEGGKEVETLPCLGQLETLHVSNLRRGGAAPYSRAL
jgi:hypothetical protein